MLQLARNLRNYLNANKHVLNLPFIHGFPSNCCEISTLILAVAIRNNQLDNASVRVVIGYDNENNESHFWLEVDSEFIDITADQFDSVNLPLYGGFNDFIVKKFSNVEKQSLDEFILQSDLLEVNQLVISQVSSAIKAH